jgi:hypothetical protein
MTETRVPTWAAPAGTDHKWAIYVHDGGWDWLFGRYELRCLDESGEVVGSLRFSKRASAVRFAEVETVEWFTERVM